jgi:hypothetical protein
MILEKINESFIYYDENYDIIAKDYYNYIVHLIKITISKNNYLNIIVGNYTFDFNNDFKTITININLEHTLVKNGGRDLQNAQLGNINIPNTSEYYMIRIQDYNILRKADIIIDYSIPNIVNIKTSKEFDTYSKKNIYISPLLYPYYDVPNNRNINCLTTFIDITQPRRALLLENMKLNNINHINISNCFEKTDLYNLYKNTKILINIHQTDHHHTFEELRVLPALLSGVIVICEESPLKEYIPYYNHVIWTTYEKIFDTISDVENNYEKYHSKIFGTFFSLPETDSNNLYEYNFSNLIQKMQKDNENSISNKINNIH